MKHYKLNNGMELPEIGFGTWKLTKEKAVETVSEALKVGYRLIDTAASYRNEDRVGEAIRNSGIPRNEIFVTSKLWNADQGYDSTLKAFDASMEKLKTDYMDIYLIHWAVDLQCNPDNWKENIKETWKAFERLLADGSIKTIGVCNFMKVHLEYLLSICNTAPALDQIELHPGHPQTDTVEFAKKNKIQIEAWSPLGSGTLMNNEMITKIAEKYNTDAAGLCINYSRQHEAIILPRTKTLERIASNFKLPDFTISEEDMKTLDSMEDVGYSGFDPMGLKY